jgi:hypothetical protein
MVDSFNCGKPFANRVAPVGFVFRRQSGDRILGTVDGYSQVMQIVWSLQDRNDGPRIAARAFSVIEDHTLDPSFLESILLPTGRSSNAEGQGLSQFTRWIALRVSKGPPATDRACLAADRDTIRMTKFSRSYECWCLNHCGSRKPCAL